MAPPPCSAKEAGSEKVSSTPRSQSGEVPGSVGARTSPQSPTPALCPHCPGGRPALPSSTKTARSLPSGPAWVPLTPTQMAGARMEGGSLHTRPFIDPESFAKRTI